MLKVFDELIISDNIDEVNISPETFSNFLIVFFCEKGALQFSVGSKRYVAEAGTLVVSTPHNIIGLYMRTPDLQGKIICADTSLFDDSVLKIFHLDPNWLKKMIYLSQNPLYHTSEFHRKLFLAYFNLLEIYLEDSDKYYRKDSIKLLAQSVIVEIMHQLDNGNLVEESSNKTSADISQKDRLFRRFITMLLQDACTDREVKAYADRLLITPKHLSYICKEQSGRTASEWITETVVRNIKYYLLQTDLTIKEIAFKMDFPDVSFFCKYTKKHLGKSPIEYRKNSAESTDEG